MREKKFSIIFITRVKYSETKPQTMPKASAKGIFAAGDCRTKAVRQLATAAADGAVCAIAACEYLD